VTHCEQCVQMQLAEVKSCYLSWARRRSLKTTRL